MAPALSSPNFAGTMDAAERMYILVYQNPKEIVDFDLFPSDTQQPAAKGGDVREFICALPLDNPAPEFSATKALLDCDDRVEKGERDFHPQSVPIIAIFDHEEVVFAAAYGANSPLVTDCMQRIVNALGGDYHRIVRRGMLVIADVSHELYQIMLQSWKISLSSVGCAGGRDLDTRAPIELK